MERTKREILEGLYNLLRDVDAPSAEFQEVLEYIEMDIISCDEAGDMVARYSDTEILEKLEALMEALR